MSAKVYVVIQAEWPSGDVAGCLLHEAGDVTHSHMSSSRGWLVRDLTVNFGRHAELEARYPDGYEVVTVGDGDGLPLEVLDANVAWRKGGDDQ